MASKPIQSRMEARIKADGGVDAAVFDRLRDGENLAAVARTYGVSRSLVWRFLKRDPNVYMEYQQALKDGAAGMVDKGQDLLARAADFSKENVNSAHVQAVRNQADYLKLQAGVTDRKSFGSPDKDSQVIVNIEQLHLAALQASGGPIDKPRLAFPPESPTQANLEGMTAVEVPIPNEDNDTKEDTNKCDEQP